jgi:anti-sigma factor RsiW
VRRWLRRRDEMHCKEVAKILKTHVDGELDPETAEKVSSHLDACLRCGMAATTYRELKARLARMSEPVDAESVERLRAFVDDLTCPGGS